MLKFLIVTLTLLGSFAQALCTDPFVGKWSCDSDIMGTKIEIMYVPPGHGTADGIFAVVNSATRTTQLSFQLNAPMSSGDEYFAVEGICTAKDTISVKYKDRPLDFRKTSGTFDFSIESDEVNGDGKLHIRETIVYANGENSGDHAICSKLSAK